MRVVLDRCPCGYRDKKYTSSIETLRERSIPTKLLCVRGFEALETNVDLLNFDVQIKVKVKEDWRGNEELLDQYGYSGKISY